MLVMCFGQSVWKEVEDEIIIAGSENEMALELYWSFFSGQNLNFTALKKKTQIKNRWL